MYGLVLKYSTLLLAGLSMIASPLETKAQGSPEASASSRQEAKAEESTSAESKQSDSGLEKKDPTKSQSAEVSQGSQPQGLANATNPIRALSAGAAAPSMGVMLAVGAGAVAAIAGGGGGGSGRSIVSTAYSYAGNVETTTVTYSDGAVVNTTANATSNAVTWASDNVTRTTTYTFAGGRTNAVVDTVPGTNAYSYSGAVETTTTTYGNGVSVTSTANATSNTVSWASDNVTRTTTYTFAGGRTNAVVDTVPGTNAYSYSGAVETTTTTYGNGVVVTNTANATSNAVTWASDNVTRTTTYTFAGGRTNAVVDTVPGTDSTPALTAAVYPSGWTTGAAVTAPSVSARRTTYGNGVVVTREDGNSATPFTQSTLSSSSITDSNSFVTSSTTTYDLRWGTPDRGGPAVAALFPNAQNVLSSALSFAGITVSGQTTTGPRLQKPASDILDAWNAGWTGKDINVLLIDSYASRNTCTYANANCHGIVVMMNVDLTAPGTNKFGMDYNSLNTIRGSDGLSLNTATNMNVVNLSFTYNNSWVCGNGCGIAPSDATWNAGIAAAASTNTVFVNLLSGATSRTHINNLANAVVTKAAGNNNIDAKYDTLTRALLSNTSIAPRLLVVGALNQDGTTSSRATIATYSDFAGSDTAVRDRFVVANGTMQWTAGSVRINGSNFPADFSGTSYAAPRVAGYAAIVMQKFPNLDAARTSNIILDTARYDTLTCHPNCDPAIYGKGEASLSRALAPIGRLR